MTNTAPDRNLAMELVRTTEAAALAASKWVGRGDKEGADGAAVDAMRLILGTVSMTGTVIIGEGEKDEAPMLFNGEVVGDGSNPQVDIAVDPIDGTTLTSKGRGGAVAVIAVSEQNTMFDPGPDVYMDKLAVGPGYPEGIIDLAKSPTENVKAVAAAKGVDPSEIIVCVLDRPRHAELIAELRGLGCGVVLIGDGDVAGVIAVTNPETTIDLYMGSGGAPEGVLAAAALRSIGGQMQGRLLFSKAEEKARAKRMGITDLNRKYELEDLAKGDVMFAATGVTDGSMLKGVRRFPGGAITHSIVMRSKTGTVRTVQADHNFTRKTWGDPA